MLRLLALLLVVVASAVAAAASPAGGPCAEHGRAVARVAVSGVVAVVLTADQGDTHPSGRCGNGCPAPVDCTCASMTTTALAPTQRPDEDGRRAPHVAAIALWLTDRRLPPPRA